MIQLAYGDDETVEERRSRVQGLIRDNEGADLVVLPELWAPGGFAYRQWEERAESVDGPTITAVAEAAAEIGAVVHAGSIIERTAEGLYNTSVVLGPTGEQLAVYRKIHRFGFGVGEPTLLQPGKDVVTVDVTLDGAPARIGLATCYDARFPELFRALLDRDATVAIIPAAWPMPRVEAWRLFTRARAGENQFLTVACNTAGTHANHRMGGHSAVISPDGTVLAEAGTGEETLQVDVPLSQVAELRERFPVLRDRHDPSFFRAAAATDS